MAHHTKPEQHGARFAECELRQHCWQAREEQHGQKFPGISLSAGLLCYYAVYGGWLRLQSAHTWSLCFHTWLSKFPLPTMYVKAERGETLGMGSSQPSCATVPHSPHKLQRLLDLMVDTKLLLFG
jgi:hypothetical protein